MVFIPALAMAAMPNVVNKHTASYLLMPVVLALVVVAVVTFSSTSSGKHAERAPLSVTGDNVVVPFPTAAAAKAAIAGMCLTMARDLGSVGIRVLAIAPSLFLTGITAMVPEEMAAGLVKDAAFPKRMGRPIEYAKLAAAIVDNPMLNGQCIRLDAGQRFAPK